MNLVSEWSVIYAKRAVDDLHALPVSVQKRIVSKVRFFSLNNPLKFAKKLTHNDLGGFRFRVGDYRIVFDVVKNKEILVLKIAKRDGVYK